MFRHGFAGVDGLTLLLFGQSTQAQSGACQSHEVAFNLEAGMREGLTLQQAKASILEDGNSDGPAACFSAIKNEINQMPYAFPLVNQALGKRARRQRPRISKLSIVKAYCIVYQDESKSITTAISSKAWGQKSNHLAKAAEYYSRAKELIEVDQDWQACGSMILKALAEERKSENTGLQVMNVIKYQKPKNKLEFNFRS